MSNQYLLLLTKGYAYHMLMTLQLDWIHHILLSMKLYLLVLLQIQMILSDLFMSCWNSNFINYKLLQNKEKYYNLFSSLMVSNILNVSLTP